MFRQMFEEKYMRFPGGKQKAVTFSYDDGVKADLKLLEIFNAYGVKATFNLNNLLFDCQNWHDRMNEEETFAAFSGTAHEVAIHGARHIYMSKVPLPEAINEVVQNRLYLENKFGKIVRGMAYAYNGYNDEIVSALKSLGVTYARTTEPSHSFAIPSDWLRLKPTCHHNDPKFPELLNKFLSGAPADDFKHREPWLFYIWGHSYEFDDNNNWNIIENACAELSKHKKDIWFATNGEIYDYVQAYNSLVFSLDGERVFNPSHTPVFIEIRSKVYKIPAGGEIVFENGN
ncbi:MAG: polysaccharide deacetylase family protein [Clostridia bacterium]|nr:polysaccharide deacetylase family protein [Clostridia bacterium]